MRTLRKNNYNAFREKIETQKARKGTDMHPATQKWVPFWGGGKGRRSSPTRKSESNLHVTERRKRGGCKS